jgi:hypothetical protein
MLNREDMIKIIKEGGSVMYNGEVYNNVEKLPSEASMAKGDKVREAAARQSLKAQIEAANKQLAMLSDGGEDPDADNDDDDTTVDGLLGDPVGDRQQLVGTEEGKAAAENAKTLDAPAGSAELAEKIEEKTGLSGAGSVESLSNDNKTDAKKTTAKK